MAIITGTLLDDLLNGTNKADTIYGLEGSDTIHGLQGNDKIVGEIEELVYTNIAGALKLNGATITLPITPPAFSGDNLFGDQGNDLIIGDLVSLVFKVEAVTEPSQTFGGISTTPITVTFGDDALDGGVGEDTLVGDVDTILLRAKAGDTVAESPTNLIRNADAILQSITLNMGVDTLYGGEGIDKLYGDVRAMTLESIAGIAGGPASNPDTTAGTQTASTRIQGITFQGGVDHLYGGNGDDFLYGDIGTLNLLSQAGNALGTGDQAISRLNGATAGFPNNLTMGGDFLYGDNGNDTLYGDIGTLNLTVIGGTTNGGANTIGQIITITFNMGIDELYGGNGDDNLYGDVGALTIFGQGGQSLSPGGDATAFIQPFTFNPDTFPVLFNMGVDTLYGEAGNDHIVGDIGTLTIQGVGGSISSTGLSRALMSGTFFMGGDTLDGGGGDDFLWGDVENLSIIGQAGTVNGAANAVGIAGSKLTMGVDTLTGGDGSDHLYGDVGAFTVSYTGGTITITSTSPSAIAFSGADPTNAYLITITMGADNLVGDNGDDFLYGDVGTWNISLTGGTNSFSTFPVAANAGIFSATFTMGNDNLDGGSGNDQLYGDLGSFSAVLVSGTGFGTTPIIDNSKIQFGNDTLVGGSGNDVLVGDIIDSAQLSDYLNAPLRPAGLFGIPPIANQIIFGNDTFEFSLGGSNGNDVVKDMNGGAVSTATTTVTNVMDTLKFTDVFNVNGGALDYTDVDAQSVFSDSGGHLKVSFCGGSVLFENIAWAGQDSVLDITPNVVVI